jgi:hemerythrin
MLVENDIISFDEGLKVGIIVIDNQHEGLIVLLNELIKGRKLNKNLEFLLPTLDSLAQYASYHFKTEEKLIHVCQYPNSKRHIQRHEEFVETIRKVRHSTDLNNPIIIDKIIEFLRKWVLHHIKVEDKVFAQYYLENGNFDKNIEIELAYDEIKRLKTILNKVIPERDIVEDAYQQSHANDIF